MAIEISARLLIPTKQFGFLWSSLLRRGLHQNVHSAPLWMLQQTPVRGFYATGLSAPNSKQVFSRCVSTRSSSYAQTLTFPSKVRPFVHPSEQYSALLQRNKPTGQSERQSLWTGTCLSDNRIRSSESSCCGSTNTLDKRKMHGEFNPFLCTSNSSLLKFDPVLYTQLRDFSSHLPERHKESTKNHRVRRAKHTTGNGNRPHYDGQEMKQEEPVLSSAKESPNPEQSLTLYQRFKKTYKEHGKVLVAVHLVTSAVWFGSFYTAARCGIDIIPYLEKWNFSEKIISPFRHGGLGDLALAYLMYKLATPARYTVTIGGTNLAIRYLRKEGHMKPVPTEDTLRALYKEGKEKLQKRSKARTRMRRRHKNKSKTPHSEH